MINIFSKISLISSLHILGQSSEEPQKFIFVIPQSSGQVYATTILVGQCSEERKNLNI